jgi:hypothetical protein
VVQIRAGELKAVRKDGLFFVSTGSNRRARRPEGGKGGHGCRRQRPQAAQRPEAGRRGPEGEPARGSLGRPKGRLFYFRGFIGNTQRAFMQYYCRFITPEGRPSGGPFPAPEPGGTLPPSCVPGHPAGHK